MEPPVRGTDITNILYPPKISPEQILETVIPDIRAKEEDYLIITVIAFLIGSNWSKTITEIIDKKYTEDSQNIKAKLLFTIGITILGLVIIKRINRSNIKMKGLNKNKK